MKEQVYDRIGGGYAGYRRPDPHIARQLRDALGGASTIVNVGGGTGSYEPSDRAVIAVEPSETMIAQRPRGAAPVVCAVAERLPLPDASFDAALAIFTLHHWTDPVEGLRELARVSARQVVVTWDPDVWAGFWLLREYLPAAGGLGADHPTLSVVDDVLDIEDVRPMRVPWDCTDGFCGAYWRRPERYLEEGVRAAISGFSLADPGDVRESMAALERDLASGAWRARHGHLLELDELDLGYRIVVARGLRGSAR